MKIAKFSHPRVFNAPAEGVPVEFCIGAGVSRNFLSNGAFRWSKNFQIGLAVLIQYRSVTDTQPPSQSRCRSYYRAYCVAQVKLE